LISFVIKLSTLVPILMNVEDLVNYIIYFPEKANPIVLNRANEREKSDMARYTSIRTSSSKSIPLPLTRLSPEYAVETEVSTSFVEV